MPRFSLKGLWDGLFGGAKYQLEDFPAERDLLHERHFCLADTFRHGFPDRPTAVAYDPLQRLVAIGSHSGALVIYGQKGVASHVRHERDSAVVQIAFLYNDGALVTACADGWLCLWSLRQQVPDIVRRVQFQRERITCILIPFGSGWLYVGTDRGNVYVVNVESFTLSAYVIYWNKSVPLMRRTHPGHLVCIQDCPTDQNKLLLAFATGLITLWNLSTRQAEAHWWREAGATMAAPPPLTALQWHCDGRRFISSHVDGALCTWHVKSHPAPQSTVYVHGDQQNGVCTNCEPIHKLLWVSALSGEPLVVFSGGMRYDSAAAGMTSVTLLHGGNHNNNDNINTACGGGESAAAVSVVEMENDVLDLVAIVDTPYTGEEQLCRAVIVLLRDAMVVLNVSACPPASPPAHPPPTAPISPASPLSPTSSCLPSAVCSSVTSPHAHALHLSPVSCCHLAVQCSSALIDDLLAVQRATSSTDTNAAWPISGGITAESTSQDDPIEILLTGHSDGAVRFWLVSGANFQLLHKIRTTRVLEKTRPAAGLMVLGECEEPLAVEALAFCGAARLLVISGAAGQIVAYRYGTKQGCVQIPSVCIAWPLAAHVSPSGGENSNHLARSLSSDVVEMAEDVAAALNAAGSSTHDQSPLEGAAVATDVAAAPEPQFALQIRVRRAGGGSSAAVGASNSADTSTSTCTVRRQVGFQPLLVCTLAPPTAEQYHSDLYTMPRPTTVLALNTADGVVACGGVSGVMLLDLINGSCVALGNSCRLHSPQHMLAYNQHQLELWQAKHLPQSRRYSAVDLAVCGAVTSSLDTTVALTQRRSSLALPPSSGRRGSLINMMVSASSGSAHAGRRRSSSALSECGAISTTDGAITSLKFTHMALASPVEYENGDICHNTAHSIRLLIGTASGTVRLLQMATPEVIDPAVPWETPPPADTLHTVLLVKGCEEVGAVLSLDHITAAGVLSSPHKLCPIWTCDNQQMHRQNTVAHLATDLATAADSTDQSGHTLVDSSSSPPHSLLLITCEHALRTHVLPSMELFSQLQPVGVACAGAKGAGPIGGGSGANDNKTRLLCARAVCMSDTAACCVVGVTSDGWVLVWCVPSMRALLSVYLSASVCQPSVLATFSVADFGSGVFLCSPSEIQKFTLSATYRDSMIQRQPSLFVPREMPTAPSGGFFQSLLGRSAAADRNIDRQKLFGSESGKPRRGTVATADDHAKSSKNNAARLLVHSSSAGGAVSAARRLAVERGQKLSQLADDSERMSNDARQFSGAARQLADKYRNKKWWQL